MAMTTMIGSKIAVATPAWKAGVLLGAFSGHCELGIVSLGAASY
jgi:hypothetical protein